MNSPPRCCSNGASPMLSRRGTRRRCWTWRSGRHPTCRRHGACGWNAWNESTTPSGGARLGDGSPRTDSSGHALVRAVALATARIPQRGGPDRGDGGAGLRTSSRSTAPGSRRAAGGIAYWQSDEVASTRWYQEALDIWRELGDKGEIANALYNRSYADAIEIMRGGPATPKVGEGRARRRQLELYREIGDANGEANVVWGLALLLLRCRRAAGRGLVSQGPRDASRGRQPDDGGVVAPHARPVGHRSAPLEGGDELARQALQHFYEAGDVSA